MNFLRTALGAKKEKIGNRTVKIIKQLAEGLYNTISFLWTDIF